MKILVTGTAGFIGFHLVNRLLKEGHDIVGIDNINDYYDIKLKIDRLAFSGINLNKNKNDFPIESINNNYRFYKCDLEDEKKLNYILKYERPSAVCHLAAQAGVRYSLINPKAYINSNILGFQNMIDSSKKNGVDNFCYASSSSVYGANTVLPFSTDQRVDHPISLYAATKKSNELVAHNYSHLYGIKTTGLRFFTVYGPWGRPDMALFLFVKALLNNKKINVYNNGDMLRDFTYIDDITSGILSVIKSPAKIPTISTQYNPTKAPYKIYNIGNNKPIKLLDFIKTIEKNLNKKFEINFMKIQPGDVPNTFAEISDLVEDFDYKPVVNINQGIKNFINWYKSYYKVK